MIFAFILSLLFLLFCLVLSFVEKFFFESWSDLSPDEILFHLIAPLEGMNSEALLQGALIYGTIILLFILVLIFLYRCALTDLKSKLASLGLVFLTGLSLLTSALYDADIRSGLISYTLKKGDHQVADYIEQRYVDPKNVDISFPREKRNLIYIFLESMEPTFTDTQNGGAFPDNLIFELSKLSQMGEDFRGSSPTINGAYPISGANWTAAGMYAQASGLPIKLVADGNTFTESFDFYPEVITLGDILEENGYQNTLMIGSAATFGGRDSLYTTHGNYNILDYNYMNDHNLLPTKDYWTFWGFEDRLLFDYAKDELTRLGNQDTPFNFTMLTVDTHFEDGYICPDCPNTYEDQYSNVMACSSKKVGDFVAWIQEQDFYQNTTIIIAGDHQTMDYDFCNDVPSDYQRKSYFTIINAPIAYDGEEARLLSPFDIFPTTLASLGATIPGDKLALGTNLYGKAKTLIEEESYEAVYSGIAKPSRFYEDYFNYSFAEDDLKIVAAKMDYLLDYDKEGNLSVYLLGINDLNYYEVSDGTLVLLFPDGRKESYIFEIQINNAQAHAGFHMKASTSLKEKDIHGAIAKAYISVRQFKNYMVLEKSLD